MDGRHARILGVLHIEYGREQFVFNLDQPKRLFRNLARFRRNRGYPVAHEPDLRIQQVRVIRRGLRPGLAGGGVGHSRNILISKDAMHSREGLRLAHIDAFDPRVRMRAAEDLAVEQPADVDVIGERRPAAGQFGAVHLLHVVADDIVLV